MSKRARKTGNKGGAKRQRKKWRRKSQTPQYHGVPRRSKPKKKSKVLSRVGTVLGVVIIIGLFATIYMWFKSRLT